MYNNNRGPAATQVPLPAFFSPRATFDQFWAGGNEPLVHHLQSVAAGPLEPLLFVWGPKDSGKTHLLLATCHSAHQAGRTISYCPLRELAPSSPDLFDGLDEQDLVCIDNVEDILGNPRFEQALFSLYNGLREKGNCLIVTSRLPPAELPTLLPDLQNRWTWGAVYRINPLDGDDTLAAVDLCARELGLALSAQVTRFLSVHCKRDFGFLRRLLTELDRETLTSQRRVTVPLVKQMIERME